MFYKSGLVSTFLGVLGLAVGSLEYVAVTLGFGVLLGCASGKNEKPTEIRGLNKIYVEEVRPKETVSATEVLEVTVKGNLPSPAYTFERFDVQVKDRVIEITPLARHDPNKIVAQVLVPFEEVCKVGKLKPGAYEVKVVGRSQTVLARQKVQVR